MTPNRWLAIAAATLIWALSFWFGVLALATRPVAAFAIVGVGVVFALYALTLLSGSERGTDIAFRAALAALLAGSLLLVAAQVVDDRRLAIAAVIAAPGVGGSLALAPAGDLARTALRLVAVGALTVIGVALYGTEPAVFGLLAPLYVLPLLAVADGYLERVRRVVADPPPD